MTPTTTAVFMQYGAIGVIALLALLAVRVLFNRITEAYEREKERGDRLEAELRELNNTIRTEYVNTISHSSQAINDATRAVSDALAAVRRG